MLDADTVINNSSQKVGGSNAYLDPAPKKVGGSTPLETVIAVCSVSTCQRTVTCCVWNVPAPSPTFISFAAVLNSRTMVCNWCLHILSSWPGGVVVRVLDFQLWRSRVRSPTVLGKLLTHTCTSVTNSINLPCCWEGNRRSGVTLAMRHRLQLFIHLLVCGLRKGNKHPAYTLRRVRHTSLNFHRFIPAFLGGLVTELISCR